MIQEQLSKRITIIPNGNLQPDRDGIIHYKGFLSMCPNVEHCFGEYDDPLEFFLQLDKNMKLTIHSKL